MKKRSRKTGIYAYFIVLGCVMTAVGSLIGIGIFDDGAASCQIEKSLCNRGLVFAGLMVPIFAISFEEWYRGFKFHERHRRPRKPGRKDRALHQAEDFSIVPERPFGEVDRPRASPPPSRELKPPSLW